VDAHQAVAAAHTDARLRIARATSLLRMSLMEPERFTYFEAVTRALAELEEVPPIAVLMREKVVEVEVEVAVPRSVKMRRSKDLSDREMQIVGLICDGLTNDEIGDVLGVSPNTVKSHVSHVLAKLNCASRAELAVHALRNGIAVHWNNDARPT
jgi:DNA-binding NarL/FixJ family response regulator